MNISENIKRSFNMHCTICDFFAAVGLYFGLTIYFLHGLVSQLGDVAQGDWALPLTSNVALHNLYSYFFAWTFSGFGSLSAARWGLPFFPALNAALAPFGFFGSTEIKLLVIFLVAFGGITGYLLGRTFHQGFIPSLFVGLFFMTTAIMFNWIIFGWIYYLIAYDLLPLMIILVKKYLETGDLRYALLNGVVLAVAAVQPSFVLVYPTCGFLFVLFESKGQWKLIKRGILATGLSVVIWLSTIPSFFAAYNNSTVLSSYQGKFFYDQICQFGYLNFASNPIRLWGSTFNFQFETYFPQSLIAFSFLPIFFGLSTVLAKPRDKRVLFSLALYLLVFVSYEMYTNMTFLVFNVPYGSIFESPSIFLVPAGLGLALLLGFSCQFILQKFSKRDRRRILKYAYAAVLFLVIVFGSIPWWTGQVSGQPIPGAPVKLNLYTIPAAYKEWASLVNADETDDYFVLYMGLGMNSQILNTDYFSGEYEGVNGAIFTQVNNIPTVSFGNTTYLMEQFLKDPKVGQSWGSYSIKYVVFYTNVDNAYASPPILDRLSKQDGFVMIGNFTNVAVFEDTYAKPIVYSTNPDVSTEITYHDPTTYQITADASTPFTLVFNQVYSDGWTASANGNPLPSSSHINVSGFNAWKIDKIGLITLKLYYAPQTIYLVTIAISVSVIVSVLLYLVFISVRNARCSSMKKK